MRQLTTPLLFGIITASLLAQSPAERLAFEVASIHPSAEQVDQGIVGLHIDGAQVRLMYQTVKDYVGMAFSLPPRQIVGPDWIGQARFDIAAKIPDGVSPTRVPEMLQTLLATRFRMQSHRDSREFPVYAITVAKGGAHLTETSRVSDDRAQPGTLNVAGGGTAQGVAVDLGGGSSFALANNRLTVTKATMERFASVLSRMMDRPVIDASGLGGVYDIQIDLTREDYQTTLIRTAVNQGVVLPPAALKLLDSVSGDPFSNQLDKLGLHLDPRKAPLDVVVVDDIDRPTED